MPTNIELDVLRASAADLCRLLEAGETTSVELVDIYIQQITKHNHQGLKLNAVISTLPALCAVAQAKDIMITGSFGLETTSGSFALKGLKTSKDAAVAILLRQAGCIVIGKPNLSEWGNSKGAGVTSGWSAVGGQAAASIQRIGGWVTVSVLQISTSLPGNPKKTSSQTPAGSSSGSAVATAAGFAPICIGTEADGSIVQPAIRAALYSMKGTVGDVDMFGTQSGGAAFDSAGPIAKTPEDCADVMEVLLPGRDFRSHLKRSWKGIGIAYLNYDIWQFPDTVCEKTPAFDEPHKSAMEEAMKKAEGLGAKVTFNAPLMTIANIAKSYKTVEQGQIARHQLAPIMKKYLSLFDDSAMKTLADIVEFNQRHASIELPPGHPNQEILENGLKDDMSDDEYNQGLKHLRSSVRNAVELVLKETGADVVMASGESLLPSIAATAGYPIASVPLGFSDYNGRPFGMEIMARNGEEEKLFEVMSAWEAMFPECRRPPQLLVNWTSTH
ncbi:hypothetical protein AK830_g1647 [Neonectria ditissima]|uniref:Amidase domain-containing protein n=1 Tax=Neonectria ditissima TaxID=78410 RepID=A0A0P7BMD4_9HYPO|nr:hypothetical protein AK830_g1647 [Neonectria ditissima]